jgi:hypothetical protein
MTLLEECESQAFVYSLECVIPILGAFQPSEGSRVDYIGTVCSRWSFALSLTPEHCAGLGCRCTPDPSPRW